MRYTVLLKDQTIGTTTENIKEGDTVTVDFQDENGNKITKTGEVVEILEENEY